MSIAQEVTYIFDTDQELAEKNMSYVLSGLAEIKAFLLKGWSLLMNEKQIVGDSIFEK